MKPHIEDAPGLTWRPTAKGWEARWMARPGAREALARVGKKAMVPIWKGGEPTAHDCEFIAERCRALQAEVRALLHGEMPETPPARLLTVHDVIESYRTHRHSPYVKKVRHETQRGYDSKLRRIDRDIGTMRLDKMNWEFFCDLYDAWIGERNQLSTAQHLMNHFRMLMTHGMLLDNSECARIKTLLTQQRFDTSRPREKVLTYDHVVAICAKANELGRPSIALAQALQWELMVRQKDIIGEWEPLETKGTVSDVLRRDDSGKVYKWVRGIRWEQINSALVLQHVTSKRNKGITRNLREDHPMTMQELDRIEALPSNGPVIVSEETGRPYSKSSFKRLWREIATDAGVPSDVFNMDTRAGANSEAALAGAPAEFRRLAMTHSKQEQTNAYTRAEAEASEAVARARAEFRARMGEKQTANIAVYQRSTKSTTRF